MELETFIARWAASGASELPNKDLFLVELCEVLEVPRPLPATGDLERDRYCFERDAVFVHEGGRSTIGRIDLYKHGCFLLEAKQGPGPDSRKRRAGRGSPRWNVAMRDALGQALGYAATLPKPPPFLLVCDLGHCFDVYASFDGTTAYRPYPDARSSRLFLADLGRHRERLRRIFVDPWSLDPSAEKVRVTREIAAHLADLARQLEAAGNPSEIVATFLMRCLFTLFAEDVGLLPDRPFRRSLEEWWVGNPPSFVPGVVSLWQAMRDGADNLCGKIRRFGGALFQTPSAPKLDAAQLERLREAAGCDWSEVEPAIFGTLLERAFDPEERHRLGAHFTPRSYVERLVRQVVEEPLRQEWDEVRGQARTLVHANRTRQARNAVAGFHRRLVAVRVLDPACGTGNFLYVTLDLLKRLESEVLELLADLGEPRQGLLGIEGNTVTPAQLHGIEVARWPREIAELVVWIGYLQWQVRVLGGASDVPEPVLQDFQNFERRDALLATDGWELVCDAPGVPASRWDRVSFRDHPITGQPVPDEEARLPVERGVRPRPAAWPEVRFVVGNPPFLGNKRMRAALGDAYVEALRRAYPEVPESADYVMYWWAKAAALARARRVERFGFITTNSIGQVFNRRVIERTLREPDPLSLVFAVPDHPWVGAADGAAVRIAMTVAAAGSEDGVLARVVRETPAGDGAVEVALDVRHGRLHADLSLGPDVAGAVPLAANRGLCGQGMKVVGDGFHVPESWPRGVRSPATGAPVVRPIVGARDVLAGRPGTPIIDFFGLSESRAKTLHPEAYQRLLTRVKPIRAHNRRRSIRELWWRFAWERPVLRRALAGLERYLVTPSTSKHRLFVSLPHETLWDGSLFAVAVADPFVFGVLSSRPHAVWARAAGGRIGVGNDPTWTNTTCFEPFPFPDPPAAERRRIGELALRIEHHRRERMERHPGLGLTALYNVVEAVRRAERLTEAERQVHDQGLASVLAGLHDELDATVAAAYGWPGGASDEELLGWLVELNAERSAEEAGGRVRWLRPELQAPEAPRAELQASLPGTLGPSPAARPALQPWPEELPGQLAAVRDLLAARPRAWSLEGLSRAFSGARRKELATVLETLSALGLALAFEEEGKERFWMAVTREVA